MSDINRVTAYLKVTAEFYDPDATPETLRSCVERDLEDTGYTVEVSTFRNWIPTEKRLPDNEDMLYLGVVSGEAFSNGSTIKLDKSIELIAWDKIEGFYLADFYDGNITVSHWMMMPDLPEETL